MDSAKLRSHSARPIPETEVPYLEALGGALRDLRDGIGASRPQVARLAQLSSQHLGQIEWAGRRTRRSTLGRLAGAFVSLSPELGFTADELTDKLAEIAGPALAPESQYADRVARRRERRARRQWRTDQRAEEIAELVAAEAVKLAREMRARERKAEERLRRNDRRRR